MAKRITAVAQDWEKEEETTHVGAGSGRRSSGGARGYWIGRANCGA